MGKISEFMEAGKGVVLGAGEASINFAPVTKQGEDPWIALTFYQIHHKSALGDKLECNRRDESPSAVLVFSSVESMRHIASRLVAAADTWEKKAHYTDSKGVKVPLFYHPPWDYKVEGGVVTFETSGNSYPLEHLDKPQ